jgi:hypothetical protein
MAFIDCRTPTPPTVREEIMTAYTIGAENNITVFASMKEMERGEEGIETFSNLEELAALANRWPGARQVDIWNSLPGVESVERFTSRRVAVA